MKKHLLVFLYVLFPLVISAQEVTDVLTVYFQKEKAGFNREYRDNGVRSDAFFSKVKEMQKIATINVVNVECIGYASPEGDPRFNQLISELRRKNITRYLRKNLDFPDELITFGAVSEDWENLAVMVEADDKVRKKEQVLEIIRSDADNKIDRLLAVDYGRPYWYMYHNIFPDLRAFRVTIVWDFSCTVDEVILDDEELVVEKEPIVLKEDVLEVPMMKVIGFGKNRRAVNVSEEEAMRKRPLSRPGVPQISLKTNAIGWGMAVANAAVEIDFARYWSVNIPVYYSGVNYFRQTLKFRVFTIQPEIRYHIPQVDGLFVGAHAGIGWYNIAYGNWRIQDAGGKRPAVGGGLGLGYKMAFKGNPRWKLEFALGAGVYDVVYDRFYNEPNGPYESRNNHKVFFGIDNASVSVSYSFDLKKKEGRK